MTREQLGALLRAEEIMQREAKAYRDGKEWSPRGSGQTLYSDLEVEEQLVYDHMAIAVVEAVEREYLPVRREHITTIVRYGNGTTVITTKVPKEEADHAKKEDNTAT